MVKKWESVIQNSLLGFPAAVSLGVRLACAWPFRFDGLLILILVVILVAVSFRRFAHFFRDDSGGDSRCDSGRFVSTVSSL